MDITFVKIGGSVITDIEKPNSARIDVIDRILSEIARSRSSSRLLIGHGSGSFAHVPAHKYKVNQGLIDGNSMKGAAITQNVAARLHRIILDRCNENGIEALSFAPSSSAVSNKGRIETWNIAPIIEAMNRGFLPVTYGDVVMDSKQGVAIASTEEVFRYLAMHLMPKRIIIGTDVDGVYTSDPKKDPDAKLIETINESNIAHIIKESARGSTKIDVTGGMKGKVSNLYSIAMETGAECFIVNANVTGNLYKAISGKECKGTKISK